MSTFVMAYGGLRGAIAFSLAVVLEKHVFPSRQLFITTTIVVVYFTNIVLVGLLLQFSANSLSRNKFWQTVRTYVLFFKQYRIN